MIDSRLSGLRWWTVVVALVTMLSAAGAATVKAAGEVTVAVLPFEIHTPTPAEHLRAGMQEMLGLRLGQKGLTVVDPGVVNSHPLAFLPDRRTETVLKIAGDLECMWVVSGSLTRIGDALSMDVKVLDATGEKPPFFMFMTAERMNELEDAVGRVASSIYLKIAGVVQIDSVRVEGNQRIENEAVLAVVNTMKGDTLDHERLDKDLRAVYKMGFFKDVSIETEKGPKGTVVVFKVTEKPSIGRIVFEGNKKMKDDDLREEVGIKLYSILDRNEVKQSINRLREFYRLKGYYNVEIDERIEDIPNNEVAVEYRITENEKVYVTKIEFLGNSHFEDDDLKDLMLTSSKGFFSWITSSGYLDKRKLEFDVIKITSFYHNHGFIKARVGQPSITYDKEKGLTITIEVEEGEQYTVKGVTIQGDFDKPLEELLEKVKIDKEKVFNREVLREDVLALRNVFVDEGYAYAEVTPSTVELETAPMVDVTYTVSKGIKVRFERINVSGNTSTRDKVIRRELKAVEGKEFSGEAYRKGTANLHRLGFFEDVEVQTKKGSAEDLMVLDVRVKEKPTGSFSAGAGYSSEDNAFVMFQVSETNFLGKGQRFYADARIGGTSTSYDLKFIEPWLFDKPISGGIDLYNWEREYDDYTRDSLGGALTIGFPLGIDDYTRGSVRYGYDNAEILDVLDTAAFEIREMVGKNVTSSTTFEIKRDSKNRPWNATEGSINSISFEYAGGVLGGDEYFNKYQARSAWFFPVFWDTVIMAQGRLGYATQRSGGNLSVFQKFKLGGLNTVRGFDYGTISPVVDGNYVGGTKMMVYNLEWRFPIAKEQGVVGVAFFDAGNVFAKDDNFTFSGIRKSTGLGFRWYSPMGPLRLEYGINIDPKEGEESGRWEFSVGGFF